MARCLSKRTAAIEKYIRRFGGHVAKREGLGNKEERAAAPSVRMQSKLGGDWEKHEALKSETGSSIGGKRGKGGGKQGNGEKAK